MTGMAGNCRKWLEWLHQVNYNAVCITDPVTLPNMSRNPCNILDWFLGGIPGIFIVCGLPVMVLRPFQANVLSAWINLEPVSSYGNKLTVVSCSVQG